MGESSSASRDDVRRIHQRIDEMVAISGEIRGDVKAIKASCGPCREEVAEHKAILHGDNSDGLRTEVAIMRRSWRNVTRGMWTMGTAVLALILAAVKNVMGW